METLSPPTNLPALPSCITEESVRQYFGGWLDEEAASALETHASQCTRCEHLLRMVETTPPQEELLQSLQSAGLPSSGNPMVPQPITTRPEWFMGSSFHPREIGPYELLEPLGHGGMGLVYLARHKTLDRKVAIKLLPFFYQTEVARLRFEREILAAGRLSHPAIVAATDAGLSDEVSYLVMEYVSGVDLGRLPHLIPELHLADICEIGRQIAMGLSYAHAQGVVHRDIKPSNVMLDAAGNVKLLDFGLVQLDRWDGIASELTTVGQFLGTLDYMAPEQAERSGAVDYRADLYSLGATLFKLLCGRAPLAASPNQSPIDKLKLLVDHRPPRLLTLRPDAPLELAKVVDQLLSFDPNERPASAAHVAEQLEALAKDADLPALSKRATLAKAEQPHASAANASQFAMRMSPRPLSKRSSLPPWLGWLCAACLPLLIWAGVTLVLETSQGQLVIDSDVADLRLQIKSDGEPVRSLLIQPGNTTTKLFADKYEIQLDAPSDQIRVEGGTFLIERGKTVIARVRHNAGSNATPLPETVDALGAAIRELSAEATYEGKTLAEWIEISQRETAATPWSQSVTAIGKILSSIGAPRNELVKDKLYPEIFSQCLERRQLPLLLSYWNDNSRFVSHLIDALQVASPKGRVSMLSGIRGKWTTRYTPSELDPFWMWMEKQAEKGEDITLLWKSFLHSESQNRQFDLDEFLHIQARFPNAGKSLQQLLFSLPQNTNLTTELKQALSQQAFEVISNDSNRYVDRLYAASFLLRRDHVRGSSKNPFLKSQTDALRSCFADLISNLHEQRRVEMEINSEATTRKPFASSFLLDLLRDYVNFDDKVNKPGERIVSLSELVSLERTMRPKAMTAWVELPMRIPDFDWSKAKFNPDDFSLLTIESGLDTFEGDDKSREQLHEWCLDYGIHRRIVGLLARQAEPPLLSPDELGEFLDVMATYDQDGDFLLSREEWPEEIFGSISPQFIQAGAFKLKEWRGLGAKERNSTITDARKNSALEEWSRKRLEKMDRNKDSKVTREEFSFLTEPGDFESIDTDGSGDVSPEEFWEYRNRRE